MRDAEEHRRKLKRANQINCHKQPRLSYLIQIMFPRENALGGSTQRYLSTLVSVT